MPDFVRVGIAEEYIGTSADTKPGPTIDTTVTLAEALDETETAIDVSDASLIDVNRSILIDTEEMYVLSKAVNTLTVRRATGGSSAATHLLAAPIYYRNIVPAGSKCYETDTGDWFITNDGGANWRTYYGG